MKIKRSSKLLLSLTLLLTLFTNPVGIAAESQNANDYQTSVVPIVQSYEIDSEDGLWTLSESTRFALENTDINKENVRLVEVIDLISAEFLLKELPVKNLELDKVFVELGTTNPEDIFISLGSVESITDKTKSTEAYKITISERGIEIVGASENAVMHALRTVMHLSITKGGLAYGTIVDYPNVAERRVHVDMGRKYFSKDWVIQQIRELSYLKMNALQIHFSENMGFRIESDVAPEIVSEDHLTKREVKEIIAEANKYGISIIPSFDTPGHTEHILKSHPEFGQIYNDGGRSTVALDITNPEAVQFVKDLLNEYLDLFEGSKDFHIGADEYMEFDRAPFTTKVQPVLNAYAVETLGEGHNWKDAMATYINELAEIVHDRGMKPRIWNDGIYYGQNNGGGGAAQKVVTHKYIGIDFWSQMSWNRSIANLQTFINMGHEDIYNINASFFYYVLRPSKPTDGRDQASFDYPNQDIRIFDQWSPGKFQENTIDDSHPSIKGASLAIWNDVPGLVSEDVITVGISKELRSLATKSWNTASNKVTTIDGFRAVYQKIGNAPSFEKGSELPQTKSFQEVYEVTFEELSDLVKEAVERDLTKLTRESKTHLVDAINHAKTIMDDLQSTQELVDEAVVSLRNVMDNLKLKGDMSFLISQYESALLTDVSTLNTESKTTLGNVLFEIEVVLKDQELEQEIYDEATLLLKDTLSSLVTIADKIELKNAYYNARDLKLNALEKDVKKNVIVLMNQAEKLLLDKDASQASVDELTSSLGLLFSEMEH